MDNEQASANADAPSYSDAFEISKPLIHISLIEIHKYTAMYLDLLQADMEYKQY